MVGWTYDIGHTSLSQERTFKMKTNSENEAPIHTQEFNYEKTDYGDDYEAKNFAETIKKTFKAGHKLSVRAFVATDADAKV